MNKTKIAICMQDMEYQSRFVNCFMNHYNHQYELHVFTSTEQLFEAKSKEYTVIITEEYSTEDVAKFVERGEKLLFLIEDPEKISQIHVEEMTYTSKYQEVYKIAEVLERILVDRIDGCHRGGFKSDFKCIGVYSLTQEQYQAPFAALLAKISGEQDKVLVIDLQPYSGLHLTEEGMASMGLEDLLSVVMTGNYSKPRILECIHHEMEWDYVCAVQNIECLAEGTKESYDSLISILVKELNYQTIIINFGTVFIGQTELMEKCQTLYLLCEKVSGWREDEFYCTLFRQEKNQLLQKIKKISIPSSKETAWQTLVDKWNWSSLGTQLRQERERQHGEIM